MNGQQVYPWEQPVEEPNHQSLLDFTYPELATLIKRWGFREVNAQKLFTGLNRRGYRSLEQFQEFSLAKRLYQRLAAGHGPAIDVFNEIRDYPSVDGSVKYVYTLHDGSRIESVFMPFENRITLCLSSQVGCALGCTFCATGAMGFKRHLTPGEMVGQVLHMRRLHPDPKGQRTRFNVVFMGMGEPLHNLNNVMRACQNLMDSRGLVLSYKDIGVSTSGLVPKIKAMAEFPKRPHLMVSIAATSDQARSRIMPVNRAYPLETLMQTLETYPLRKGERIMLSYVLIAGVNDHAEDADRLITMSQRFPSLVNLIPMNEHEDSPNMKEPSEERLKWFYQTLSDKGVFTTVRRSRGRDIGGACGQLSVRTV